MIHLVLLKVTMKASMFQAPKQRPVLRLSWQTGHAGDPHKRSFYVRHFILLPTKRKSNELFSKADSLFQSIHFHESQCHPQHSNEFLLDAGPTSQGYPPSFHRKNYASLIRESLGKLRGKLQEAEHRMRQTPGHSISTEEHPGKAKTSQLGYILCKRGLRKEASVSCSPVLPSGQTHQEDNLKCLWGRAGREERTSVSWKLPRSITRVPPTSCPCAHLMCS